MQRKPCMDECRRGPPLGLSREEGGCSVPAEAAREGGLRAGG